MEGISMRPILYPPGTTDFTNLGIGKLRDTISAEVYEARNGAFTLEIEYPVNGVYFDQIKEFSYIKAKPNDRDDYHTFIVHEVAKSTSSRSVIVQATTKTDEIGNTLVTMATVGNPQFLLNAMKTTALDPISYSMYSDITTSKKVEWVRRNPLNALVGEAGSLVHVFGGELKRTDSTISLYQRRGNDKVAKFTARRGLKGAKIVVSTASIVTRILPYITILGGAEEEDVTLTGTIVNSPLVNNYPVRPLVPVDFGMIDDTIDTLAKLNSKAATYFTSLYPEIDKPKVSIDLDLLSLQDTSEYAQFKAVEKIELCDTIDVHLPKYDVVRTVKVTELYYDSLREINTRIVAGDKSVSQIDAFKKEYSGQVSAIKEHLSKVENTMMVKGDGTQIWSGPDTPPPDKVNINDIWWKKTGEDKWSLLIWNGLIWEDMLSDEIFKEIDIKIEQAETDIAQNIIDIEAALDKATQAELDAGFATDLAEDAKALGVSASTLADAAKTNANTAMVDAQEAIRQALLNEGVVADASADSAEARRLAGLAEANAQEAKTNANTAVSDAQEAIADAEEALRQVVLNGGVAADASAEATEAKRLAGLAEANAQEAKTNASTAISDAQEALTKANTSITDSSTALTNANKAFNKSVKSSAVAYATSTNGNTPPTTGWASTHATPSPDVYIWTRTTIVLNDNTPVVSYSVGKIGAKGDQGLQGAAGGQGIQGVPGANAPTIKSVVQQFYLSTSNTTQTGGSWLATVPVWSSGKYYWVRVLTTYSNDATSTSTPVLDNALNDSLITALEAKTANQTLSTTVTQHATLIEAKANSSTVDALTGRVSTAEGTITAHAGQIALKASTTDLNTLTGRVSTAEGTITAQAGQIALRATTATVNTLTGRVSTAEGKITTQAGLIELKASTEDVDALTGRVSTAEGSIQVQAGQIALRATTATVNALTGRVSTAETNISANSTAINLRATKTSVDTLTGRVTTAEGTIEVQAGQLALKASQTSVDSITGRVATAETNISANTTAINLRATKTSVDTLTGRVTTAEGAITVQAGQIASKVSQTDFNALNGRVGTAESTITQQAGEIALRVTTATYNTGIGSKENTITKSNTAPAHLNGRLWLDTSVTPNVLKRSTGTAWVKVTPTTPDEVGAYSAGAGSALAGRVTTAETSITANTTAINLRATKTDLDAAKGRLTTAEGSITVQAGQIALKASQTSVDTLTGKVSTAETNISANTTAINLRATKTSVDTLTGRVTTAEGTITAQAGQIALRATTATVNALTGRVSTAEGKITVAEGKVTTLTTKSDGHTTSIGLLETSYSGLRSTVTNVDWMARTNGALQLAPDPTFLTSSNRITAYNNSGNTNVTVKRVQLAEGQPTGSPYIIEIATTGSPTSPGLGGIIYGQDSRANAIFMVKFTAKLPTGYSLWFANNPLGTGYKVSWVTDNVGTGLWTEYAYVVQCGPSGSFSNFGHLYILTGSAPVKWYVAKYEMFDIGKSQQQAFSDLQQDINGFKTTVQNTYADKTTVSQLAGQIELRATKTDVNALTGRVSTAEGKITTQAGQIALMATTATVNTLTGRVTTAEGKITAQAGLIELRATTATVNTLTGRVGTAEGKITVAEGKVTTLTTKTDGHTTSIGQLQTSYSGLTSTVTQIQNDTSDIINQFKDSLFKTVTHTGSSGTGWTTTAETNGRSWTNGTGTYNYFWFSSPTTVQLKSGREYQVKVYLSADTATDINVGTGDTSNILKIRATTSPTWFVGTIKLSNSTQFAFGVDNGRTVKIRELYIYESSTGLTTNAFSTLEQNINGFKTTVQDTYATKTTVNQLAGQWQTTTTLANGHTTQISSMGTAINLRATKTEVDEKILTDKKIKDTRTTNELPSWYYTNYPSQQAYEFKQCTTIQLPGSAGTYASVVTEVPWTGSSGGSVEQTATADDGVYKRRGTTTWGFWARVADSNNIVSQINISPESILIASKKIQIKGDTYIDNGVIKTAHIGNLAVTGAQIATATIGSSKIISLDVDKITGNTATFVRANFNSSTSALTLTAEGMESKRSDGSISARYLSDGMQIWGGSKWAGSLSWSSNPAVTLWAKKDHMLHLGYQGTNTSTNTYSTAVEIDGTTGKIYMGNLHPRTNSANGLWFENGFVGGVNGVFIRNNNSAAAGIFFGNNGSMYLKLTTGVWRNMSTP